jgi:hypothetical protein
MTRRIRAHEVLKTHGRVAGKSPLLSVLGYRDQRRGTFDSESPTDRERATQLRLKTSRKLAGPARRDGAAVHGI